MLLIDPGGKERVRIEGYLPPQEFQARLEMGLGRIAVMAKRWVEAERRYGSVAERYADAPAAPEAIYWEAVARYNHTKDHVQLGEMADRLERSHPRSEWTMKASIWAH